MSRTRNDLELYEEHSPEWWDERSAAFRSLRAVKAFQLGRIERALAGRNARLAVDLGCGGGLLALPLSRSVERVVGVDRSAGSLRAARDEARRANARCNFVRGDLTRVPLIAGAADLVVLSDVIEHVEDPGAALREAARLARTGGLVYVNTINSTRAARWLGVTLAEAVGLVPRGTHDPRLFVAPERLAALGESAGLALLRIEGEAPRLLRTLLRRAIHVRASASTRVTYNALFEKRSARVDPC